MRTFDRIVSTLDNAQGTFNQFSVNSGIARHFDHGVEIAAHSLACISRRLDNAHTSNAQIVHHLLHLPSDTYGRMGDGSGGNQIWNPRRARELEFTVRAALHRYGLSDISILLRRMIGKAFPGDSISHLGVDLLNVFFWSAMAQVARDYVWRDPRLEYAADYLEYPVKRAFLHNLR